MPKNGGGEGGKIKLWLVADERSDKIRRGRGGLITMLFIGLTTPETAPVTRDKLKSSFQKIIKRRRWLFHTKIGIYI